MDPETQRLIEKTRQRREMLNQRMANLPEAAPRKRRTPVLENESENILTEKQTNQDDISTAEGYHDSPKRACVRDVEQEIKPDTPAIRSVQSRAKDLPSMLSRGNEENTAETPTPKPRKSVSSPPLERRAPTSFAKSPARDDLKLGTASTRKNRFAALANNINNWEDDLTRHVVQKEEEKKPKWQPPAKTNNMGGQVKPAPSGKGPAPTPPVSVTSATKTEAVPVTPKKADAPAAPSSIASGSPAGTLTRNSPLRSSKVELNHSPKPFSSLYGTGTASPSRSATEISKVISPVRPVSPAKAVSDTLISSSNGQRSSSITNHVSNPAVVSAVPPQFSVITQVLTKLPVVKSGLDTTADEPTLRPVSERLATWSKKVGTPVPAEPSRQPLSAKLATFEKKISQNTPKTGHTRSVHVPKTPKQICTPVLSASTPASSSGSGHQKVGDPSELPVSQRMSQMQEKLSSTPQKRSLQDEPTAYPVGARMSAWENMTASNLVSDIKKVNPGEAANKPRPASEFVARSTPLTSGPPQNPPPPPAVGNPVSSKKSFKESIQEKASQVLAKREIQASSSSDSAATKPLSPVKTAPVSPSKIRHSPSKVSAGTKTVQKLLIDRVQDSNTTCSSMAAQIRAARLAELEVIQNRWQNGVLREDVVASSNEAVRPSEQVCEPTQGITPRKQDLEVKTPTTNSKREESRNKARAEFNNKLAQVGLGNSETPVSAPLPPPPPPPPPQDVAAAVASSTPSSTGGTKTSSIYNLIKKREEGATQATDNRKVKFDDSFDDSDDDGSRKIPNCAAKRLAQQSSLETSEFKKPQVPKLREDSESDVPSSSDQGDEEFGPSSRMMMEIDDDDISLKGFVSEATRRESILPASVPQSSSQSSLDSYDDDRMTVDSEESLKGSSSKRGGYHPDDDSTDDCDDRHAVDDLIDEALNDTSDDYDQDMDPRNVVLRRKPEQDSDYDPDMDINNVVMRKKTPVPAQRSNMKAAQSSDDDDDDRPYSLEAYRKSATINQHTMEPIIRKSRYADSYVEEEDIVMPTVQQPQRDDKRAVLDHIRELQELVQHEQSVIMQTSNALNKCCMGNSYFAGSTEQVECNRLLLIACQKRQGYMTEIQRLKETGRLSDDGPGPRGSLTISDIRLPLKKDFVTKIGTSHDNTTHYFILLIRNGAQLICTEMLSTHDPMMRGSLDFPNLIKINGITGNFNLTLDIYSMSVSKEVNSKKSKKTPKKGKGYALTLESPGGPTAVRTTSFSQVSSLQLTMKCLDKNSFHLDRLPYLSPLYGQIFMRLKCSMEAHVEERGFLTMFDDVSGFGAWHRRWCVLTGNKVCVWKYPDDETRKDPMTFIDLKRCITEKVGLVPRDVCARPNTFEMTTVRQLLKGEHDTLISRTHNSTTLVRHQMSADSKEERIVWCNKINRALANLRTWNADALKPVKQMSTPTSSSYR